MLHIAVLDILPRLFYLAYVELFLKCRLSFFGHTTCLLQLFHANLSDLAQLIFLLTSATRQLQRVHFRVVVDSLVSRATLVFGVRV